MKRKFPKIQTSLNSIQKIIQSGADINALYGKKTLIQLCIENNAIESVNFLLNKNCSTNGLLQFAVSSLTSNSGLQILKILLDFGIDPNFETPEGITPLYSAGIIGRFDAAKMLIEYGANPAHIVNNTYILSLASAAGDFEFVQYLLSVRSPISSPPSVEPPIAAALENRHLQIVEYFLSKGADPNTSTEFKMSRHSLLDIANLKKNHEAVRLLLTFCANPRFTNPDTISQDMKSFYIYTKEARLEPDGSKDGNIHKSVAKVAQKSQEMFTTTNNLKDKLTDILSTEAKGENNMTPILTEIRSSFSELAHVTVLCYKVAHTLRSRRIMLIDSILSTLSYENQESIQLLFRDDEAQWKRTLANVRELVGKIPSVDTAVKQELVVLIEKEERKQKTNLKKVFKSLKPSEEPSEETLLQTRQRLMFLNDELKILKLSIGNILMGVQIVSEPALELINIWTKKFQNYDRIIKAPERSGDFDIIGFNTAINRKLKDTNHQRIEIIGKTLKQLKENKESFQFLSETLSRNLWQALD